MKTQEWVNSQVKTNILSLRDNNDDLSKKIRLLRGTDKMLMKLYVDKGQSFRQLAKMTGVNESAIARRVHKISERLNSPYAQSYLRNSRRFGPVEKNIIKDYLQEGLSQREISLKRNITRYKVRRTMEKLIGF